MPTIKKLAEQLQDLRHEITVREDELRPLKEEEAELREQMVAALKKQRLKAFKGEDGVAYVRAYRTSYSIADDAKAMEWAQENNCVKIDTTKLSKILRGSGEAIPDGFEFKETEFLTIKTNEKYGTEI